MSKGLFWISEFNPERSFSFIWSKRENEKSEPELPIVMNIEIINLIPYALMTYAISYFHFCVKWWAHVRYLWNIRCLKLSFQLEWWSSDSNLAWSELRRVENFIGNIIDTKIEKFINQSAAIFKHNFQSKSTSQTLLEVKPFTNLSGTVTSSSES